MSFIKKAKITAEGFVQVYDHYVQRVYHYLLRRVNDEALAEDLTSQVWEKVLKNIQKLKSDEESGFAAWLFAIARNELNQFYKNKFKGVSEEIPEGFRDPMPQPDEIVHQMGQAKLIHHGLAHLPIKQREVVELKYFGDLRNKEIALILKVSEKTVASNLSRALKTLQTYLEKLQ